MVSHTRHQFDVLVGQHMDLLYPGVTSKLIYDNLRPGIEKSMCKKEDILNILKDKNIEVLITLGAGDIDNYVPEIKELLETKKLRMNNEE